ncbi:unnamed protein product [Nyctereutes procyonoides]|uniref:(raccoon dog) hypothetical protein n=1 Tax=Nyctereutes procyonoides TaxID=34880 RepID=A0A811ZDF9_NYCPR|nr:unnamed protein product [Nyctereutes procyonoides]
MRGRNATKVSVFVLLGFPTAPRLQYVLFLVFLLTYLCILVENLVIIVTVRRSAPLHRPMYYFLGALSVLEVWYVSDIIPKMLGGLLLQQKLISFAGCMTQLYFFSSLVCSLVSRATFCGSNVLNHFFCDISPILKLACTDFSTAELVDFILAFIILVSPLVATVLSYGHITLAVLRIPSATGRWRAFSTCASHLTVVTIFYTALLFMYVRPQAIDSRSSNKLISVVYTVLTPIINPLIYCLRNKEFKAALRKALGFGQVPT